MSPKTAILTALKTAPEKFLDKTELRNRAGRLYAWGPLTGNGFDSAFIALEKMGLVKTWTHPSRNTKLFYAP